MIINELLAESTSRETALRDTISAVNAVKVDQIYKKLETFAIDYVANKGTFKGFTLVVGGMKNRLFQKFFIENLRPILERHLLQYLSHQVAAPLKQALHYSNDIRRLKDIEDSFPDILKRLGKDINSKELYAAAQSWETERDQYYATIERLKAEIEDEEEPTKTKTVKDPSLGKQLNQIELLVNDVLKDFPEKVRGEIRLAISRDDNKLLALQRELNKRNIKMNESQDLLCEMFVSKYFPA